MNYYNFKVGVKNDVEVRTYCLIKETDMEYIKYDSFLKANYFTSIDENDDFIPMILRNEVTMVLRQEQFEPTDIEDIFEMLNENLYVQEEDDEKSVNY